MPASPGGAHLADRSLSLSQHMAPGGTWRWCTGSWEDVLQQAERLLQDKDQRIETLESRNALLLERLLDAERKLAGVRRVPTSSGPASIAPSSSDGEELLGTQSCLSDAASTIQKETGVPAFAAALATPPPTANPAAAPFATAPFSHHQWKGKHTVGGHRMTDSLISACTSTHASTCTLATTAGISTPRTPLTPQSCRWGTASTDQLMLTSSPDAVHTIHNHLRLLSNTSTSSSQPAKSEQSKADKADKPDAYATDADLEEICRKTETLLKVVSASVDGVGLSARQFAHLERTFPWRRQPAASASPQRKRQPLTGSNTSLHLGGSTSSHASLLTGAGGPGRPPVRRHVLLRARDAGLAASARARSLEARGRSLDSPTARTSRDVLEPKLSWAKVRDEAAATRRRSPPARS